MFSFGHVEQSFSLLSFIIFLTQFSIFFFRKSPRHTILPSSSPQMKKPLALNCGALFGHQHISNWMSLAGGGGVVLPFEDWPTHDLMKVPTQEQRKAGWILSMKA